MEAPRYNDKIWVLPGGSIKPECSLIEGIERKVFGETGCEIKICSDRPIYIGESNFYFTGKFFHSLNIVYSAKPLGGVETAAIKKDGAGKADRDDTARIEWVDLSEINENNCHPIMHPAIEAYKR